MLQERVLLSLPQSWTPRTIARAVRSLSLWGMGLSLILLPWLWKVRTSCPPEALQGDSVQYLYCHVPWAFSALFLYGAASVAAFFYLLWPIKYVYYGVKSFLLPIWLCTVGALVSGALWGKETWGTYWIWDARLTSFLVLSVFVGLLIFISAMQTKSLKSFRKVFCILVLIGLMDLILTHYSVVWFKTLHQGPGLLRAEGSSLDPVFARPLWYHIGHMLLWSISWSLAHFYQILYKELSNARNN